MKTSTILGIILTLLISFAGLYAESYAQTASIASEAFAKEIAANAGGTYVQGATAPALSGSEVALPVIEESSGQVIGHIVADQSNLVAALNAAGYTEVATGLAAVEAGTVAGTSVAAGVGVGTTTAAVVGAAVVVGLAVSGGGGGGTTTTSHH